MPESLPPGPRRHRSRSPRERVEPVRCPRHPLPMRRPAQSAATGHRGHRSSRSRRSDPVGSAKARARRTRPSGRGGVSRRDSDGQEGRLDHAQPGKHKKGDPIPATIVSGSPMPRSRAGTAISRARSRRLIRDASAKSTSARVVSAIRRSAALGFDRKPPEHRIAKQDAGAQEEDRRGEDRSPEAGGEDRVSHADRREDREIDGLQPGLPTVRMEAAGSDARHPRAVRARPDAPRRRLSHLSAPLWPSRHACRTPRRAA